jgi:hypothetical protein
MSSVNSFQFISDPNPWVTNTVNEVKSAASFCCQVAAWFSNMFCNFYLMKNYKIAKNSTSTKARKKITFGIFRILDSFG